MSEESQVSTMHVRGVQGTKSREFIEFGQEAASIEGNNFEIVENGRGEKDGTGV